VKHRGSNSFGIAARLIYALLGLITSVYCMLAYLPDIYVSFIQAPLNPWLPVFIRLHSYIYGVVSLFLGIALVAERRTGRQRRMVLEFVVVQAAVVAFFLWKRPFSSLGNNSLSLLWSLAILFPIFWLGILDHYAESESPQVESLNVEPSNVEPSNQESHLPIPIALQAGLTIGILLPGMLWLSYIVAGRGGALNGTGLLAWAWAIGIQLLFAVFAVSCLNLVLTLCSRVRERRWRTFCFYGFVSVAVGLFFIRVVLPCIPFAGREADIYSAALSVTIVCFSGGFWRRIQVLRSYTRGASDAGQRPRNLRFENGALILILLTAMYVVPSYIGIMDWNFILARMWAALLWLVVTALLMHLSPSGKPKRYPVLLLVMLCAGTFVASRFAQRDSSWMRASQKQHPGWIEAIGHHTASDASFGAVVALWAGSEEKPCDEFCRFLREQTNIPAYISVEPVDIKLVDPLTAAPDAKPNIFVIVVDSLRRDYVSPYNPAVQFTPHIGEFAAESVVMRNAFTRYGGTSLSEAAIWSGTLMLHKQFVQPFHPMNNLEKMLEVNNYDRYVSIDPILKPLIEQSKDVHRLDADVSYWADQDFCRTAVEAEQKIDQRPDKSRPIFLYTQPQNVHLVALMHAQSVRPPQPGRYPGFQPSAANELLRFDDCFGRFISYLKSRGLYDNSIVVLTADHGEAYGEFGHISHAYGLYPSTLRIPLMIHLPKAMQKRYYYDPQAVAFNMDVTPSLYSLLGYRHLANDEKFGRPLFTQTREEYRSYQRDSYLVSVCYNPIYGVLAGDGKTLFIANETDGVNQYFDLVRDPDGTVNLIDDTILARGQSQIRQQVQDLADYYQYQYHTPTLLSWAMR
jgi:arylsulfatase A-like enzyme